MKYNILTGSQHYKKEGASLSKPVKTIDWTLYAILLAVMLILLVLSRCHPNVLEEKADNPAASQTTAAFGTKAPDHPVNARFVTFFHGQAPILFEKRRILCYLPMEPMPSLLSSRAVMSNGELCYS